MKNLHRAYHHNSDFFVFILFIKLELFLGKRATQTCCLMLKQLCQRHSWQHTRSQKRVNDFTSLFWGDIKRFLQGRGRWPTYYNSRRLNTLLASNILLNAQIDLGRCGGNVKLLSTITMRRSSALWLTVVSNVRDLAGFVPKMDPVQKCTHANSNGLSSF